MGKREAVLNLLNMTCGLIDKVSPVFYYGSILSYVFF